MGRNLDGKVIKKQDNIKSDKMTTIRVLNTGTARERERMGVGEDSANLHYVKITDEGVIR